ncbi:MAG: glycosyltransferase family 2 protein [Phaeodactylibacter sp.]|nr:glycosyltransferase family 2 protein [Phaeodactylibacter sp.]
MPRIYVLIVNYLNYRDTLRYVQNLQAQEGVRLSILVVDNASPNESAAVLARELPRFPNTAFLESGRNGGYAYGVNSGLRYLAGKAADFILISNNDIRLEDPLLIRNLAREYPKLPAAAFIAPSMYVGDKEDQKHQAWKIPTFRDDVLASLRLLDIPGRRLGCTNRYAFPKTRRGTEPVDCLSGSFFLGSKEVFQLLGPWDEQTFLYVEESILGWKIKRMGRQNYLVRSLRFDHDFGRTTRTAHSLAQLQQYWLESAIYFQHTYRGVPARLLVVLRVLFRLWIIETFFVLLFRKLLCRFQR